MPTVAELYKKDLDKLLKPGIHFLDGNTATAEGAVTAGCRFYAGYPITPSNEIAEYMSYRLPQVGGKFIQMEDEIASIAAVLGASAAGVKSMTATSGPGFSLMQENIGLGSMLEIPAVIVDVMRAGPSTGIPTLLGQGDILQAKYGSHGDYEIVAYLPANPQEAFDFTIKAFNTAEKYRVVAVVLSDQLVGHMYGKVRVPEFDEIEIVERPKPTVPPDQYLPYDSKYLVPPMAIAGTGYRVNNESLTHTDKGYPTTDKDASFKLVMRLVRKIRENEKEIAEWEEYLLDDAEYVIVSYGSTSGSVRRAIKVLRTQGYRVGLLRPKTAWPFPGWVVENLASRGVQKFITVEVNMGKMYHVVREFSRGIPVEHIPYAPGYIPDPDYVISNVKKVIEG
jgi:2-oxoglutarate ferredoxin oxidoreductase subunit alpha